MCDNKAAGKKFENSKNKKVELRKTCNARGGGVSVVFTACEMGEMGPAAEYVARVFCEKIPQHLDAIKICKIRIGYRFLVPMSERLCRYVLFAIALLIQRKSEI